MCTGDGGGGVLGWSAVKYGRQKKNTTQFLKHRMSTVFIRFSYFRSPMALSKPKWDKMHRILFQGKKVDVYRTCKQEYYSVGISCVFLSSSTLRAGLITGMDARMRDVDR